MAENYQPEIIELETRCSRLEARGSILVFIEISTLIYRGDANKDNIIVNRNRFSGFK
ncbi:MAG: hypothetical protein AB1797_00160 [bacterium]